MIVLTDKDADKIATFLRKELINIEDNYKSVIKNINHKLGLAKGLLDSAKELNAAPYGIEDSFSVCLESAEKAKDSTTKVYELKKNDIENCLTLLYSGSEFYGNE